MTAFSWKKQIKLQEARLKRRIKHCEKHGIGHSTQKEKFELQTFKHKFVEELK